MARINYQEAQEISSKGGNFDFNFFFLKDRETKKVRFLYANIEELENYTVHQIEIYDQSKHKNVYKNVNCLRASNEPVQKCPLCAMGNRARVRVYLTLLGEDDGQLYVWERSGKFIAELEGFFKRYGDLRDYVFEIERRGAAGSKDTTYQIYPIGSVPIQDKSTLPTIPEVFGKLILDKTAEDLDTYIRTGVLPGSNQSSFGGGQPAFNNTQPTPNLERRETTSNFPPSSTPYPDKVNNYSYDAQPQGNYAQPQGSYNQGNYNQPNYQNPQPEEAPRGRSWVDNQTNNRRGW